ncbi:N-6 DNA methylase [Mycoplasmopsis primatum]|uniref:N-6 DNA methylase n=1 Tax=Mycoplasmopsis primatum TaxID=55604 RepID=UPI000496B234|nr:N-6 DNA methylase [Mycoplasmopsis primatum]
MISNKLKNKLEIKEFTIDKYHKMIDTLGLAKTWDIILDSLPNKSSESNMNKLLAFQNLGELYEIGLAHTNKIEKKDMGKYYTPYDVSVVMAQLLLENKIDTIADVGCGTGNLIIEVLKLIKQNKGIDPIEFIKSKKLYLFDSDPIAMKICLKKIDILFGTQISNQINSLTGDFLNKKFNLPAGVSVITNPPYAVIKKLNPNHSIDDIVVQSKDLYASFINKIMNYCNNAVIVSPQSYLVADKFSKLREKMTENFEGEIFSFDNVPGTLFNGRKHGIFNTNNANGVRASITSLKRKTQSKNSGFKLTHLIRFRTSQRKDIINLDFLRSKLGTEIQKLNKPLKAFKELEPMIREVKKEKAYLYDLMENDIQKQKNEYKLYVSTSARYFVVASKKIMKRKGYFIIYGKDQDSFDLLYSLLNSSYAYMWWRFIDGGILLTKKIICSIPYNKSLFDKINQVEQIISQMINNESKFVTYKVNAGEKQESIKFPDKYRQYINEILFPQYAEFMKLLHKNYEVKNE